MSKQIIITVPDHYYLENVIKRIEMELDDPKVTVEVV